MVGRTNVGRRARRNLLALAAVAVCVMAAGPSTSATAATPALHVKPIGTWGVYKACSSTSTANCGTVYALAHAADAGGRPIVYVGGNFTHAVARGSGGTTTRVSMPNLAAFYADTGQLLPTWSAHTINGSVNALAVGSGGIVYAGGTFTRVDCPSTTTPCRNRVAAFDGQTGALTSFNPNVTMVPPVSDVPTVKADGTAIPKVAVTVNAVLATPDAIYLGGNFAKVKGVAVHSAVAVAPGTGGVLAWAPALSMPNRATDPDHNKVLVRSITSSPDGSRIYVGGDFDKVSGAGPAAIAAFHPVGTASSGQLVPMSSGGANTFNASTINATDEQVFDIEAVTAAAGRDAAGVLVASGGKPNRVYRLAVSGSEVWRVAGSGDMQAVTVLGDTVYVGGHFDCLENCYPEPSANKNSHVYIGAIKYTGSVIRDGRQFGVIDESFGPDLGPQKPNFLNGVWALGTDGHRLYAGGVFNWVSTSAANDTVEGVPYPVPAPDDVNGDGKYTSTADNLNKVAVWTPTGT